MKLEPRELHHLLLQFFTRENPRDDRGAEVSGLGAGQQEEDPSGHMVVDQHLKLGQLHHGYRQAATTEQMLVEELN